MPQTAETIKGWPWLGLTTEAAKDSYGFFEKLSLRNSAAQKFVLAGKSYLNINHPELVKYVMHTNHKNYVKGAETREWAHVLGAGLIVANGPQWLKQRRAAQPLFQKQAMEHHLSVIQHRAELLAQRWLKKEQIYVFKSLNHLSLDVVMKALFAEDFESRKSKMSHWIDQILTHLYPRITGVNPFPFSWSTLGNLRIKRPLKKLDEWVFKLIDKRRKHGPMPTDNLLDRYLFPAEGEMAMSDQLIRDELVTFLIAGHETVAVSMGWFFYCFLSQPEKAVKLREELNACNYDPQNPYLRAFCEEVLRMYPAGWILSRKAIEPDQWGDVTISPEDHITIPLAALHRHPNYWENASVFMPERFLEGNSIPQNMYFPFGKGPRACIGDQMAMHEMTITTATILKYCKISPISLNPGLNPQVTLKPQKDIIIFATPNSIR